MISSIGQKKYNGESQINKIIAAAYAVRCKAVSLFKVHVDVTFVSIRATKFQKQQKALKFTTNYRLGGIIPCWINK